MINSFTSRGPALGATTEQALTQWVTSGIETLILTAPSGNNAAGMTLGNAGVPAPGGDAYHLMPGKDIAIDAVNAQKLFIRGAATDKVYILAGNMS